MPASLGLSLTAEDAGARLSGTYRARELAPSAAHAAELASELPAGAHLYVSFNDLAAQIRRLVRCAGDKDEDFDRTLAPLELALGVSLEDDLLPLLENEGALVSYGAAGSEIGSTPNERVLRLALVTRVGDEERALRTLDGAAERAAAFTDEIRFRQMNLGGVRARHVSYEDFSLLYAVFDGKLVLAPSEAAILALREEGRRLADDRTYRRARELANAPDETSGFVYARVADAAAYLVGLAESRRELRPGGREHLDPLRSLFVYGTAEDDAVAFEGFLEIE